MSDERTKGGEADARQVRVDVSVGESAENFARRQEGDSPEGGTVPQGLAGSPTDRDEPLGEKFTLFRPVSNDGTPYQSWKVWAGEGDMPEYENLQTLTVEPIGHQTGDREESPDAQARGAETGWIDDATDLAGAMAEVLGPSASEAATDEALATLYEVATEEVDPSYGVDLLALHDSLKRLRAHPGGTPDNAELAVAGVTRAEFEQYRSGVEAGDPLATAVSKLGEIPKEEAVQGILKALGGTPETEEREDANVVTVLSDLSKRRGPEWALSKESPELAAINVDWGQVVMNGGPPCFHVSDGRFCLRAERWDGHGLQHRFVSLLDMLSRAASPEVETDG